MAAVAASSASKCLRCLSGSLAAPWKREAAAAATAHTSRARGRRTIHVSAVCQGGFHFKGMPTTSWKVRRELKKRGDKVRAEEALREKEAELAAAAAQGPQEVYVISAETEGEYYTPGYFDEEGEDEDWREEWLAKRKKVNLDAVFRERP